jgi:uncharacterized repeat protein (TIGR01451 family)
MSYRHVSASATTLSRCSFAHQRAVRWFTTLFTVLATLLHPQPATASDVWAFTVDDGGVNQIDSGGGNQRDLTRLGVDDSHAGFRWITWSWDSTNVFNGGNTGDGCAYFDTDSDGNANYIVCAQITNSGAQVRTTNNTPGVYACTSDNQPDKCNPANVVASSGVDMLTFGGNTDTASNDLRTNTDPFVGGDDAPDDVTIVFSIPTSFLPATAQLLNVCSRSSGTITSDSADCIFKPTAGFLTIVKQTDVSTSQAFSFAVSPAATDGTTNFSHNGPGVVVDRKAFLPNTYSLTEAVPAGWTLNGASCVIIGTANTATGTPPALPSAGPASAGITAISIQTGRETVCTFANIVTFVPNPAITLDKAGVLITGVDGRADAGDTVSYSIFVTNTGNVALNPVIVSDPQLGNTLNCQAQSLAPGASTSCTGTHSLTQLEIDAGVVNNTATANGTPPTGAPVSAQDSFAIPITRVPRLTIDKTGTLNDGGNGATPGDLISYNIVVENTGNQTLSSIVVADPLIANLACPGTTLAPGEQMTCTGTYAITQANIDAGAVVNTASADSAQTDPPVTDSHTVPLDRNPRLSITKDGVLDLGDTDADVGDIISYEIIVTNIGNQTLTGVTVTDSKVASLVCAPAQGASLAPGAAMTCTGTYAIAQLDIDAGTVENTATGDSDQTDPTPASDTVSIPQAPSLGLSKRGTLVIANGTTPRPGDVINYEIVVSNDGNQTLTGIVVTDPLLGASLSCPSTTLAPATSMTCTGTYTIMQTDIDAGKVDNTATADSAQTNPVDAKHTEPIPRLASLSLTKDGVLAAPSAQVRPDDLINYTLIATNNGNQTLTGVMIVDPKLGALTGCTLPATLAPGTSITCNGSYAVVQTDIDAGVVHNTATADSDQTDGTPASDSVDIVREPGLNVSKEGVPVFSTPAKIGDVINYTIIATNYGNQTLTGVTVSDAKIPALSCVPAQPATLAPNASITCTGAYAITQSDIDAGKVDNTGIAVSDQTQSVEANNTESVPRAPQLTLEKTGTLDIGTDGAQPGDKIDYVIVATNNGNQTLGNVTVSDATLGALTCTPGNPLATLAPGAKITCTGSHLLTQADIDAGVFLNTAKAISGETPDQYAPSTVTIPQAFSLNINKTGTLNDGPDDVATPGDVINYTIVVVNTGNVTLHNVTAVDPKLSEFVCPSATLAPGASFECVGVYAITQTDIDAGKVDNTATADSDETPEVRDSETVPLSQQPGLSIEKMGALDVGGDAQATPDDRIFYTITVRNVGNITLNNVSVDDSKLSTLNCSPSGASLAPGAIITCLGTYRLTQVDIDAGFALNVAGAASTQTDRVTDDVRVLVPQDPDLSITKSGELLSTGTTRVGDVIRYTIIVENVGNTTVANVTVEDTKLTSMTCIPALPATLAPGARITCTGDYALLQSDIDAGTVLNVATARSPDTGADPVENEETITQVRLLQLEKSGAFDTGVGPMAEPDDLINYTLVATNLGNTTLQNVTITDPLIGVLTCNQPATLAPGASLTCTGSYAIDQEDIDAGEVRNTATASADQTNPAQDSNVETIAQAPDLSLSKQGAFDPGADGVATPGDRIYYTITLQNTGNLTLLGVTAGDPKVSGFACTPALPIASLAPGAVVTCTGTYAVTQADIDRGYVDNVATASSTQTGSVQAPNTEDIRREPGLNILKDGVLNAGADGKVFAGDRIEYVLRIINNGNTTLSGVVVSDPLLPALTCLPAAPATLAPNATMTCTGVYVLKQTDIDAGIVRNTATADSVETAPVSASDDVAVPQAPSLALDKDGVLLLGTDGKATVGDVIEYTLSATNNGNQTLTSVRINDPRLTTLTCNTAMPATLAPGASLVCTGRYPITQQDIDAGKVNNVALSDSDQTDPVDAGTETDVPQQPVLTLEKIGQLNMGADGVASAGDTVRYTLTARNTGNRTLTGVTISDAKLGALACTPAQPATLAPGALLVCTGEYAITQQDIDAGIVENKGVADSTQTPPVEDVEQVTLADVAGIDIAKTPDNQSIPTGGAAVFTITVRNTGNVTLQDVVVSDVLAPACNRSVGSLAVGASTSYTCTLVVSSDLVNTAAVIGRAPDGSTVSDSDTAAVDVLRIDIEIEKQISNDGVTWRKSLPQVIVGTRVNYRFIVQNTGEAALSYEVKDPMLGDELFDDRNRVFCSGTLAAGATVTCGPFGYVPAIYAFDVPIVNTVGVTGCYLGSCDSDEDSASYTAFYVALSPGFWKNHSPLRPVGGNNAWRYTAYPDQNVPLWTVFKKPACLRDPIRISDKITICQALALGGGPGNTGAANILMRAGVAALLNASMHETQVTPTHPRAVVGPNGELLGPNGVVYFPYSSAKVIALVNAALASCDRITMLTLATELDAYNNGIHLAPWTTSMTVAAQLRARYALDRSEYAIRRTVLPTIRRL